MDFYQAMNRKRRYLFIYLFHRIPNEFPYVMLFVDRDEFNKRPDDLAVKKI